MEESWLISIYIFRSVDIIKIYSIFHPLLKREVLIMTHDI